jgi:hypothetical protein
MYDNIESPAVGLCSIQLVACFTVVVVCDCHVTECLPRKKKDIQGMDRGWTGQGQGRDRDWAVIDTSRRKFHTCSEQGMSRDRDRGARQGMDRDRAGQDSGRGRDRAGQGRAGARARTGHGQGQGNAGAGPGAVPNAYQSKSGLESKVYAWPCMTKSEAYAWHCMTIMRPSRSIMRSSRSIDNTEGKQLAR